MMTRKLRRWLRRFITRGRWPLDVERRALAVGSRSLRDASTALCGSDPTGRAKVQAGAMCPVTGVVE